MSLFLTVVPVSKAVATVKSLVHRCEEEHVSLDMALHRVLVHDVCTDVDIPGFTRSVVDGFAVRAADSTGAGEAIPAMVSFRGRVAMGATIDHPIQSGECIYVPTGAVLPEGADAVVMVENTEQMGEYVLIKKPVAYGENVLFYNEDFSQGDVVLGARRRLSPQDIGVLAAAGCTHIPVVRMPKVGIISTGNELVPVSAAPCPGQVRDVNSYMVGAFVRERGCLPVAYGIIGDDRDTLRTALSRAVAQCDAVIISGGSSKDDRDMAAATIKEQGEVLIHGVAIAPGKPTIIGQCGGKPVIGLPGHPASAFIVLLVIGRHLLAGMTGDAINSEKTVRAKLTQNIPSAKGREDYVRVLVADGMATPLFGKSGLLNTLVRSTGVIRVPAETEGLERGERVEVILW